MESFGVLLRRHRLASVLTQEALAERARISVAGISALEGGRRRAPRATTIALLLDALDLDDSARAELVASALMGDIPLAGTDAVAASDRAEAPARVRDHGGNFPGVQRRFAFVGRSSELIALHDAWSARVRVVVVSGEAGVGKTRLVGEFAAALANEATVLWGRCTPDRLGAYEPFVDPIRALVLDGQTGEPSPSAAAAGSSRQHPSELARLVPELAAGSGQQQGPSEAEHSVERRLLFEAVAGCFTGPSPALLVLDDLHWADQASMALLAHLAANVRAGNLVIVAVVRDTDVSASLAGALAELRRVTSVERIDVGGLGGDDLTTLISAVAGAPAGDELVHAIAAATEGNPFFVEELTEHLLTRADETEAMSVVPRSVRETLGKRIDTLSPPAQALLRAGAVLGRAFDLDIAGRITDLDGEPLLAAAEDALLSGLVTEVSATHLTFSHALVQSAVYETTLGRRRLTLHRRAAFELEQAVEAGESSDSAIFDLARHWTIVARSDPAAERTAAHWAMVAGDAAAAATDIDEAIVRYQQAERLLRAGTAEYAEALIRLGAAVTALGRLDEADEHLRAAQQLADGLGDDVLFARAVIGRSGSVRYGHSDPERIAALERSIAALGPEQHVLRITAASMLKRQLGYDPSDDAYHRRQQAAAIVLEAVTAPDVPRELLLSLGSARDSMAVDDPVQLGRLSRQMIEAASAPRNLGVLANAWFWNAWSTMELGDLAGWVSATSAFTEVAEQLHLPFELSMAGIIASTIALLEGRYADSESLSQQALALGIEGGDPNAGSAQLIGAVLRGLDLGQAPDMIDLMKAMRAELADVPTFMGGLTMTAAVAGDHDLTRELLAVQTDGGFERAKKNLEWLPSVGFLSHACAIVDDVDAARVLRAELSTTSAKGIRIGPIAAWFGPVDHHRGALCRVLGDYDEAETRLRAAAEMCEAWHSPPWLARAQIELARTLRGRGGADFEREADALHTAAMATLHDIGAVGVA